MKATSTPVVARWHRQYHGPWTLLISCECGADHRVAEGGVGPAPQLRGGAVFTSPSCPQGIGRGELVRVSVRLNPLAGGRLARAAELIDQAAVALLEAADVTERSHEQRQLQEASRTMVGTLGRVRFLHDLAVIHPDHVEAILAGAST